MVKNIFLQIFSNFKTYTLITLLLTFFNSSSYAKQNLNNKFFIDSAFTIEYNAPKVSGSSENKNFNTTEHIFKQIYNFENIVIGGHIRFHENFGLNANWVQTNLSSKSLENIKQLEKDAQFKIDHYNFSLLTYAPIVKNFFELFAELGLSDMRSNLSYVSGGGNYYNQNSHQTLFFYGGGFQINLSNATTFRLSTQRYVGNIGLINSDYSTIRLGFLRFF